ncbi:MAG: hypothetical protein ABSD98_03890 [Candidatus Korobacteraceae bacterium]
MSDSFIRRERGAEEIVTKLCRPYGTQINFSHLTQHSAFGSVLG